MTKGLHKNSLRKVDNPHQWMIDDARMELIQQIKSEVERKKDYALEHYQNQGDIQSAYNLCKELISFISDLEKSEKPNSTNWEQIEKRAKESEKALDYMREHPLTHEQAVEQAQRLKEEEKPTTAGGLEEEMERFMSNLTEKKGVFPPLTRLGFKAIARHFYEFGRQSQPKVSEGLEEYASKIVAELVPSLGQKYSDGSYVGGIRDYFSREELIGLVKAGAKWKMEQSELSCEGLEEEIGHWFDKLDDKYCMLMESFSIGDVKETARHFYELGRQGKSIGWSEKDTNILSHIILTLAGFMSEGKSIDWLKELPYRIQRSESKMNEDLEKEIESFWDSFYRKETRKHSQINNDFRIVARHFAQWQKSQMIKEEGKHV